MSEEKNERTLAGAVGIFFLCGSCMIIAINVALAVMFGTWGSSGGLLVGITSLILAIVWKNGSISTGGAVGVSVIVGLVGVALMGLVVAASAASSLG